MALWKISVKNSGYDACNDKQQWIEKGMFIETSTRSSMSPLDINRERPLLARLFMNKYGTEIDPNRMNESYFKCENVRI